MSVNQFGGILVMNYLGSEVPPPVPSMFWAGLPPTPPAPVTVTAGALTSVVFSNIATSTAPFRLLGGSYGVIATASTWGTLTLQILSADQLPWVTALTASSSNSFATSVILPNGIYRLAVSSVANAYVSIQIVV